MDHKDTSRISRLERARQHLDQAVARLEGALEARAGHKGNGSSAEAGELEALRSENAALRQRADMVSQRLDAVIGRLHGILEN